jgi:dolichol-phosphate mannosyltransferase
VVYICIPARNEESTIGVLLWKIRRVMADFGRDYEILVLDDGSTDDTRALLSSYRRVVPLRVLNGKQRLGYSGATEELLREAVSRAEYPKRDVAVTLQADFSDDPGGVVPLMKTIEGGADIVSAAFEEEPPGLTRAARVTRWLARNWLRGTLSSAPVSEPLGGFRAYRIVVLKKMFAEAGEGRLALGEGWAGNLELLQRALPHARSVAEAIVEEPRNRRVRRSRFRAWRTLRGLRRARARVSFAGAEGS